MPNQNHKEENEKRAENYISDMIRTTMSISAVLVTISVAILAIIQRLPPSLTKLIINFFVLLSVIVFILSFNQGRKSHGTLILALLREEGRAADEARLPTLKYYRMLSLGLISLGIACALFFVPTLIDLPLVKPIGIMDKITMIPILHRILNSFGFLFIMSGLLGQIGSIRKFPFSSNPEDLKQNSARWLGLNGYQVWKWSWILILVGAIIQLITIWIP